MNDSRDRQEQIDDLNEKLQETDQEPLAEGDTFVADDGGHITIDQDDLDTE